LKQRFNIRGLDAYYGTPVLDLKPYDSWDMAQNARVPKWREQLEKEKQEAKATR
jgi:tRNA (Thr-GGU) A37 N-methylase